MTLISSIRKSHTPDHGGLEKKKERESSLKGEETMHGQLRFQRFGSASEIMALTIFSE
jgi:hypothetical protein